MLGTIAAVVGIAGGINSLTGGGVSDMLGFSSSDDRVGGGTGSGVQQAADPFAPYRANLASMYSGYLQPGANMSPTTMPGYSAFQTGVLDPAMEASKRSAAASGMGMSGKEQAALQDVGQRGYYGFMTDYLNRLAQGSGAVYNPATAAGMGVNQGNLNNAGVMQGLGSLATGLSGLNKATQTFDTGGGIGSGMASSAINAPDLYNYVDGAGGYDINSGGQYLPIGYANL